MRDAITVNLVLVSTAKNKFFLSVYELLKIIFWGKMSQYELIKRNISMIAKSMRNLPRGRDFGDYFKPSLILYVSDTCLNQRETALS